MFGVLSLTLNVTLFTDTSLGISNEGYTNRSTSGIQAGWVFTERSYFDCNVKG